MVHKIENLYKFIKIVGVHAALIILVILNGCNRKKDSAFVRYQSFDEFTMTEINSEITTNPYLLIKRTNDTIRIVQSNHEKDTMIYLNKGDYWYSSVKINYHYSNIGKLFNYFSPVCFCVDYRQVDVYRYITNNSIIEAYFYSDGDSNTTERGIFPDYIEVYNRNSSRTYTFADNLDNLLDSTVLGKSTIWQVYKGQMHSLTADTLCLDHKTYNYDRENNLFYWIYTNNDNYILSKDSLKLNALGIYHVPTYQFMIENGAYIQGDNGIKMRIDISCTTLETDFDK